MIRRISILVTLISATTWLSAEEYYVAVTGADSNTGSIDQPFATVQQAVDLAKPGTRIFLREGRYHQRIDLSGVAGEAGAPVVIQSYAGEDVVLDNTFAVTSAWSRDRGEVYQTRVLEDVTQLFIDGKLMTLARFPNALAFSDEVWRFKVSRRMKTGDSKRGIVKDNPREGANETIADANVDFSGCVAVMNFGDHVSASGVVYDHSAGSDTFKYRAHFKPYKNTHNYFLEGGVGAAERVMLDMPQEWAYDETTKVLYLWSDDGRSPQGRQVYARGTNPYLVTGDAATRHVMIDGIDFFAGTLKFTSSDYITLQNCESDYYTASKRSLGEAGTPTETFSVTGSADDFCVGLKVFNCAFRYADSGAFVGSFLEGAVFANNLFYQIDYACVSRNTLTLGATRDLVFRRNTLDTAGSGLGVTIGLYDSEEGRPWTCEYNFLTRLGLLEGDGSGIYSAHEQIVESVSRYNWFISNRERDFRWDGWNDPLLGVRANFYRNVAMADRIKTIAVGDGVHLKGDYHEVYNNVGVYKWSSLEVSVAKGGNAHTITRNNIADDLLDHPMPGDHSHNQRGGTGRLLRDPDNWDFRPRATAAALIDRGAIVDRCQVNGQSIDVTAGYNGEAPDIGAYEFGDDYYWIPGRMEAHASMPVPRNNGRYVQLDTDLMYLTGLEGKAANIYFGTDPENLDFLTTQDRSTNIVKLADYIKLDGDQRYFWRVDTVQGDDSVVTGEVWTFKTKIERTFLPWDSVGIANAAWKKQPMTGDLYFDAAGKSSGRRALLFSKDTFQSDRGFTLTVGYTTDVVDGQRDHGFSFGLIRAGQPAINYLDSNPFGEDAELYSLGINLVAGKRPDFQGLNFTDGSKNNRPIVNLNRSGTNVQFEEEARFQFNESHVVKLTILPDGQWWYSINGVLEGRGTIRGGFDMASRYRVAVFARDFKGSKRLQHLSLSQNPETFQISDTYEIESMRNKLSLLAESQTWVNSEGVKIVAAVRDIQGTEVIFFMDGKEIPYPISGLSDESQEKLKQLKRID